MALDLEIARSARILVDIEGITFDEAQARLRSFTLEILVGEDANSPAAHAAILTAVSVGRRTFVGGVRITGAVDMMLNSALPLQAESLKDAATEIGATNFESLPSYQIVVGSAVKSSNNRSVSTWWKGWQAGTAEIGTYPLDDGRNPLVGIAAGAIAVGKAFEAVRGHCESIYAMVDLWPTNLEDAPEFNDVYLPGALWLIGLGNLGQAFLWALAALPYREPAAVSLVLQDRDRIKQENWSTSVLVIAEKYGDLKTRVAESWAMAKGFSIRRIDRFLGMHDRLEDNDPRIALSGVDKIAARSLMARVGFECIIDAGLGRTAVEFDHYRVTLFSESRPIDAHFEGQVDVVAQDHVPEHEAYKCLEKEVGRCGAVEIAGASVAAPYVSAVAAVIAVARAIAVTSGCMCPSNEVGKLSSSRVQRLAKTTQYSVRGCSHAGRPADY